MDDWLKIMITLASVVVAWLLNEHAKLKWEKRLRKEDRYKAFLESIRGFYVASQNIEHKERFLQELRLVWLYCPDDVIKSGNAFLRTVATGAHCSDEEKERALAEFEIALRRDLHGRKTKLTVDDYHGWRSTYPFGDYNLNLTVLRSALWRLI